MDFSKMIDGPDGHFGAYMAHPASPNGAVLIVIQEIFGVNEVMRELADQYASLGYIAIVPDLFWRIESGISLSDKFPDDMARAFELFGKFNLETGIVDIQSTINFARTLSRKVGAVGYCLGGLLAYLTACETDIDASVSYYGVSIDSHADQGAKVTKPLMLHVASEDKFVSKEAQLAIGEIVQANSSLKLHLYQGLDHAFARPDGEHYDSEGAALANARTAAFLAEHLL